MEKWFDSNCPGKFRDSFVKTFQKDGLNVFRRGVLLTWMRLGPQSTLMLMILSKLEKYFYETHDAGVSN